MVLTNFTSILVFVQIILTTFQAIALGLLSEYFVGPKTPESTKNAYLMASTIALAGYLTTLCRTWEFELGLETCEPTLNCLLESLS